MYISERCPGCGRDDSAQVECNNVLGLGDVVTLVTVKPYCWACGNSVEYSFSDDSELRAWLLAEYAADEVEVLS